MDFTITGIFSVRCFRCKIEVTKELEVVNQGKPSGRENCCKPCNLERAKEWYDKNKDKKRAYDKRRREEKRHLYRAASKRHRENNRDKKNLDTNIRRRRHRQATPSWANRFFVKEIYELAQLRSRLTGIAWHVDHIIPLTSKAVCGLHVHENLQVIPAIENITKGNHYSMTHNGHM